ncbi:hypothetical protein JAAARDRAFT_79551 [Jaapia argillacea MUCL 33604]|uniref:Uncharacterized protein n=1 Tax=Jaapia argillacea MUCL 33604 TaxID=933084 RepID=A0A067PXR1_9AGAM|nr:hypothetical protein JAAARDRAFT_79551 [Jaapia argillacea MUCL 33604]
MSTKPLAERAFSKYTKAIQQDPNNAVLYSNRAACSLQLERFPQASTDATKATKLDPHYTKAWARLAAAQTALGMPAAPSWIKALEGLHKSQLTPQEKKQKESYETALKAAIEKDFDARPFKPGEMPWDRAKAMTSELVRATDNMASSSAWVILFAYRDFEQGNATMDKITKVTQEALAKGPMMCTVAINLTAVVDFTSALMRDMRISVLMGRPGWLASFNSHLELELQESGATEWSRGDAVTVTQQAYARQIDLGWDAVQRRLSRTVRSWILYGALASFSGQSQKAVENMEKALHVLDWGRKAWKNARDVDRGMIFCDTFTRGVRVMYMRFYLEAWNDFHGPGSKYTLEALMNIANMVIKDLDEHPPIKGERSPSTGALQDPGFVSSFYIYPRALALMTKGYFHKQKALISKDDETVDTSVIDDHLRTAANFYLEATRLYPEDEEDHALPLGSPARSGCLQCGLENLWSCGTPLKETLPLMKRIRVAVDKKKRIWEHSPSSARQDKVLLKTLWVEEDMEEGLKSGMFSLEDKLAPKWYFPWS